VVHLESARRRARLGPWVVLAAERKQASRAAESDGQEKASMPFPKRRVLVFVEAKPSHLAQVAK